jgi:protease-4
MTQMRYTKTQGNSIRKPAKRQNQHDKTLLGTTPLTAESPEAANESTLRFNSAQRSVKHRLEVSFARLAKAFLYGAAVFGLLCFLVICGMWMRLAGGTTVEIPDRAVLHVDLNTPYAETRGDSLFSPLTDTSSASFFDLVRALRLAMYDDRIVALSATIDTTSLGLAQTDELLQAVADFRQVGKKTYVFSHGMGSFGTGNREYMLASAFDEIWLQPHSEIGLTGIGIEVPFFKNALNKFGIEAEFYTRYEYKTAADSATKEKMTAAYRSELGRLGQTLTDHLADTILNNRPLKDDIAFSDLTDQAPIFSEDAVSLGLADKLGYQTEFTDFLKNEFDAEILEIEDYMMQIDDGDDEQLPEIGLMVLEGVIDDGDSATATLDEPIIGAQSIIAYLDELKEHDNLKALLLRINSPGGSYTASDEILNALRRFKQEKQIPIIVSMGDYAASGGYDVALAGDLIFAQPDTITGSIGVLGGKIVLEKLWQKLGVSWQEINFGSHAGILSMNHPFSDSEKAVFNRSLDRIYEDFTTQVIKTRPILPEQIDQLARGRVWSGDEAAENGLVDRIGGLLDALVYVKEITGLSASDDWDLLYYPKAQSWQERLFDYIGTANGRVGLGILQTNGLAMSAVKDLTRLRFDAVLPPMKINF